MTTIECNTLCTKARKQRVAQAVKQLRTSVAALARVQQHKAPEHHRALTQRVKLPHHKSPSLLHRRTLARCHHVARARLDRLCVLRFALRVALRIMLRAVLRVCSGGGAVCAHTGVKVGRRTGRGEGGAGTLRPQRAGTLGSSDIADVESVCAVVVVGERRRCMAR